MIYKGRKKKERAHKRFCVTLTNVFSMTKIPWKKKVKEPIANRMFWFKNWTS